MIQRLLASVVVLVIAAGHADAGLLSLNLHSQTTGSSIGGSAIPDGLDFDIHAIFQDDVDLDLNPGIGIFLVTQIDVEIDGTPIPVTFTVGDYAAYVLDPTNGLLGPFYFTALVGGGALIAAYDTATPPISGDAPMPTVFSDRQGSLSTTISFQTPSGDLILESGINPIDASITAVPEPSTLSMCGVLFGLVGLTSVRRRRKGRAGKLVSDRVK